MGGCVVRGFLSFVVDAFLPRCCLACGREMGLLDSSSWGVEGGASGSRIEDLLAADLAYELRGGVSLAARLLCDECRAKLETAHEPGVLTIPGAPEKDVPVICPFFTNDQLLGLVRFLKFSGGRSAVPALGWWMARALEDYLGAWADSDPAEVSLVPVPLHPSRERSRGYNQAFLLAWEVGERLGFGVESRMLRRIRNTKSQSTLDPARKARNLREAFALIRADLAFGRKIIVVDDLVTTGETAAACVAALEPALPASIAVLAAGRVRD